MHGSFFASGTGARFPIRQCDARTLIGSRCHRGDSVHQGLRRLGDAWRSDPDRSSVVFRQRPHRRQHAGQHERLLQPECRRSAPMAVRARSQPASLLRPNVRKRERPPHVAGDAAQQGERLLGRAVGVPNLYRRNAGAVGAGTGVARGRRRARPAAGCDPGHLVVPAHESTASSKPVTAAPSSVSATSSANRIRHAISIRVVEQCASGCAGERQHSRAGVSIAGLQRGAHRLVPVEGIDVVRHRHAQPEGRVSAHVDDRRSHVDDEQSEPDLPLQQRRAESAHAVDFAVGQRRARRLGRACSCRSNGRASADAAGRRALRSGPELVPGAAGRPVAIPADADHHSGNARRRQLQGHHAEVRLVYDVVRDTARRRSR